MQPFTLDQVLDENFSEKEKKEIDRLAAEKTALIRMQQVRKAKNKTQKEMAQLMGISQSTLSEFERRPNVTISTMQRYIEALGGKLIIKAEFQNESEVLL